MSEKKKRGAEKAKGLSRNKLREFGAAPKLSAEQKQAKERLLEALSGGQENVTELLWETLRAFSGFPFHTVRGLGFTYEVRGFEMFVDRKQKTITRSSVELALNAVKKLDKKVKGPKKLGVFGASYLYPVFQVLGIIY